MTSRNYTIDLKFQNNYYKELKNLKALLLNSGVSNLEKFEDQMTIFKTKLN